MKRVRWATAAACVALIALIGCRGGGQVYQVKDAPVQTASGKDLSLEEVRKEIIAAGVAAVLSPTNRRMLAGGGTGCVPC